MTASRPLRDLDPAALPRLDAIGPDVPTFRVPPAAPRPSSPREAAEQAEWAWREPTFDELVHGYGRHRGDQGTSASRGVLARWVGRRAPRREAQHPTASR